MKSKVDNLGGVGIVTDVDASELPPNAWTSLLNLRCTHGRIQPMDGYADWTTWTNVGTKDVYAHALTSIATSVNSYWVYPYDDDGDGQCEAICYTATAAGNNVITRSVGDGGAYAGGASDLWNTCQYNGMVILNNGSDCPQYWDGNISNLCKNLPWDATGAWHNTDAGAVDGTDVYKAKVIRSFRNFLFALNIDETIAGTNTKYHQMVHWSSIADPGNLPSWDYSLATEDSGRVLLADTDGWVLDAVPLGEQLIVYKEDSIYAFNYVGGAFVFANRLVTKSHGLWSTNCAVDIGGTHVCLGDGVVYTFDGRTPTDILTGRLAEELFDQIDSTNYKKCFLFNNKLEREVWICFPELGETWATKALIWNYGNNTWYYRTIPKSSTIKMGIVDDNVDPDNWDDATEQALDWTSETLNDWESRTYSPIGDTIVSASDQLIKFDPATTTSGVIQGIRTNIILEDPTSWYMTKRMYPIGTGESFSITIGGQTYVDGPVTWESTQAFDPGVTRKLDWRSTYPIKAIKVEYSGSGTWTFDSYVVEHEKSGQR